MQTSQELVGWRMSGMIDVKRNFGLQSTTVHNNMGRGRLERKGNNLAARGASRTTPQIHNDLAVHEYLELALSVPAV
jgi:hypothetical protein